MARSIKSRDNNWAKGVKLVPTEIIALYGMLSGIVAAGSEKWGLTIIALAVLITTPFFLKNLLKVKCVNHIIISTIAVLVWIYWIGGPFIQWGIHEQWIGSAILAFWSFVIPMIYKKNGIKKSKNIKE